MAEVIKYVIVIRLNPVQNLQLSYLVYGVSSLVPEPI